MSHLPNPFVDSRSNSSQNRSPHPITPTSNPGFLMITRPPSAAINYRMRNLSSGVNNGKSDFLPFGSPREYRYRTPVPRHSYRGRYNSSGSRNFTLYDNNAQELNSSVQLSPLYNRTPSPQNYTPTRYQSTPRGYNSSYQRGRYSKNNTSHRTPLKDIPIDKFISLSMIQDPWNETELYMTSNICEAENSEKFSESNRSSPESSIIVPHLETNFSDNDIQDDFLSLDVQS